MGDAPKLLPCPFCRGDDTIIVNGPVEDDWCAVRCEKCMAQGPHNYSDRHSIAAWNMRAPITAQEARGVADTERAIARLSGARRKAKAIMHAFGMKGANRTTMLQLIAACDAALTALSGTDGGEG